MKLSSGDRFDAEVNLLRNRTASVNVGSKTITVGPLICEDKERVQLRYLGTRNSSNTEVHYAVCLSSHAIDGEEYNEYLRKIVDLLTPEGLPSAGERTYVEISAISADGIGYAEIDDKRINLGPVDAQEGDFVQIEGYSETHARVIDDDIKGQNYELKFSILTGQWDKLPISTGEEYTTAIAEFDNETPICYVKDVPVSLPESEGQLGQKLDVRIDRFEDARVVGEVLELYDEVSRIKNPGHWARMQWLRDAGFDEPTLQTFTSEYIGVDIDSLPDDLESLEGAVVSEAIRLCLADKAEESEDVYPRAHITGIRHWVTHKLEHVLGEADNEENWFRGYLDEGKGPTLTFLGDIIRLSHGYYAAGPTRAVMVTSDTAVLVSGTPTRKFLNMGLEVQFRNLSRILVDTSESELEAKGILTQTREEFIGDTIQSSEEGFLTNFVNRSGSRDWDPEDPWESYGGESGFGLTWRDQPLEIKDGDGRLISLWREPIEYGGDEYYLRVATGDEFERIRVPYHYLKHVALAIDAAAGTPRTVDLSESAEDGTLHLACSFSPPRSQYRWLTAIGARWRGYHNKRINWEIPATAADSVVQIFNKLPVEINDRY